MSAVGEWGADEEPVDEPLVIGDDDPGATSEPTQGDDPSPPRYATLDEFVDEFLVHELWVDTSGSSRIWCPQWWRHSAAIIRLEAAHRSFEHLRQDPAVGISTWLRDHADYHMGVLTDPNGPFKGCSVAKGHDDARRRVIPAETAPAGLFEPED